MVICFPLLSSCKLLVITISAADDTKLLELTKSDLAELSEEHPGLFKELELSATARTQD